MSAEMLTDEDLTWWRQEMRSPLAVKLLSAYESLVKQVDAERATVTRLHEELAAAYESRDAWERHYNEEKAAALQVGGQWRAERAAREQAEARNQLDAEAFQREMHKREQAEARVKELEVELSWRVSQSHDNENAWACEKQKRVAAESALASARALVEDWFRNYSFETACRGGVREEYEATRYWLSSHPAPVAAPCAGSQAPAEPGSYVESLQLRVRQLENERAEHYELERMTRSRDTSEHSRIMAERKVSALEQAIDEAVAELENEDSGSDCTIDRALSALRAARKGGGA